jgi:putative membrane protein
VIATGLVLAGLAALVHVYIFVLESVLWTSDRARATFGTTREEAEATRALAFNQGFYNLFLAIAVVVGIVVVAAGHTAVGATLVLTGAGSMVAAGLVLMLSDRTKTSAALKQAVLPLLGVVALVVGLVA